MPYNPGVQFDPGIIERGFARSGAAIAGTIQDYGALKKQDKAAKALFDALEPEEDATTGALKPHPLGLTKDAFNSLSAQDRIAKISGFVEAEALKSARRKEQMAGEEMELRKQEAAARLASFTREQRSDDALATALQSSRLPAVTTPGPFGGPVAPPSMSPDRLLAALAENPQSVNARGFSNVDNIVRAMQEQGGEIMPVARRIGGRDLLVNPRSGAFQDVTPSPTPQIPEGMSAIGATEDENGRLQIRYGFPKAEGKALTQTEVAGIAALNQAEMDLDTLENIYKELGPDYGGPVSARVKSFAMGGQNPNIAALENAITAATPNLARGVFREVGVLTDQDVARYKKLLPSPTDTQEVRTRKIKQLRDRIAAGRKEVVTSLKAAGRDVEGFSGKPGVAAATRFDSEAAARAGGAKAGDVIELYDPATATYRKARLK